MTIKMHMSPILLPLVYVAVAAGLCVLLFHVTDSFEYSFLKLARHDIRQRTETVTAELMSHLASGNFGAVRAYAEERRADGVRVTVMDPTGKIIIDTGKPLRSESVRRKEFIETLANGEAMTIRRTENLGEYMLYSSRNAGGYVVRLAIPYRQAMEPARLAVMLLAVAVAAGVFLSAAVFLTMRHLHRRIAHLASEREEQARRVEEAARMERFRQVFVENISHEIKTPLASLSGAVEMLCGDVDIPAEERDSLAKIATRESGRLERLVNDILCLAGIESAERGGPAFEICDLASVVKDAVDSARQSAAKEGAVITCDCPASAEIRGDAHKLETAVANLLSNAVKYGGGSEVRVSLTKDDTKAVLRVSDKGPGIAAEHIPRIFERFYRVDKGRSRKSGGTGLGLSIVKHVALLHGGTVSCVSEPGKGSVFTMELPCVSQS